MDSRKSRAFAGDPFQKLKQIREKNQRTAIGLMSGTSADGIDVALVEIVGRSEMVKTKLLAFHTFPFDSDFQERILGLGSARAEEICEMNFLLGGIFGKTVLDFLQMCKVPPPEVDFIGSHGQTVCHISGHPRRQNSTLQIGEGAVIAARTGILTICDFRPADIALGGTGAPLVPYTDYQLFRKRGKIRALVNIGGIANVTVVPEQWEDVLAFDTGPGNMIMDGFMNLRSKGKRRWDPEGKVAGQGKVNPNLLGEWMEHPYFSRKPPKSTGRETFGESFIKKIWNQRKGIPFPDLMATANYFTAASIYRGFQEFIFPFFQIDEVYISGGGLHNRTLVKNLKEIFCPIPVWPVDVLGIHGDAKEAMAFALLADATLRGFCSNAPRATGAQRPAILGKIAF